MKAFLDFSKIEMYINLHKKLAIPFEMTVTNYTTRIKSSYCDNHFLRSAQSNRMFAAYAKLKKDVSAKPVPVVDRLNVKYFDTGFNSNLRLSTVYNFDLKSAYATCLFINGFISKETFNYLGTLPKLDRLAAIGMLAGRKSVFNINEDGNVTDETTNVSPFENFFFYCVDEVSKVMQYAASYMGNSFLFTWVDGIYFNPEETAARSFYKIVSPYFIDKGYKTSFDILNNFVCESKNDCWNVSFMKDGKPKIFNIPKKEVQLKKRIETLLLNKKYKFKTNEKSC